MCIRDSHKPAKDIYDDGRLFLDFSEQTASLNGKPLTLSPMEYKMPVSYTHLDVYKRKMWMVAEQFSLS